MPRPICPDCGAEIPPHAAKCPRCGRKVILSLEYEVHIDSLQTAQDFQVLFRDIMEAALAEAVNLGIILDMKRSARHRGRKEQLEISQLEYVVKDREIRSDFFRYVLTKIENGSVSLAKIRDIAAQYIAFRDAQAARFSTDAPHSLSQASVSFYEDLLTTTEGSPTTIADLSETLRIQREKQRAAAGEPYFSVEMQAKVNRFITATAMAKASRNVGMNPKIYVKQAQSLLDELRNMAYPRVSWLEERMREVKSFL